MFLTILLEIIGQLQKNSEQIDEKSVEELKSCYQKMTEKEQQESLRVLEEIMNEDIDLLVYVMSFLLQILKDAKVVKIIQNILSEGKVSFLDNINLSRQLRRYLFSVQLDWDSVDRYKKEREIHEKLVQEASGILNEKRCYIPYSARNAKRVVLLIEPLLGESHAPTRRLINLYHLFEKLGYEVYVYAINWKLVQELRLLSWWNIYIDNCMYNMTGEFSYDYMGVNVHGYHINYSDNNYVEETRAALNRIADYNPAFVMAVGEANILADLCNEFTTVVTMGCVNRAPITTAPFIARYFECTEAEKLEYQKCLEENQKIIDFRYVDEIHKDWKVTFQKSDFGIAEKEFVIIIAGNRLEEEVTDDVTGILFQILKENEGTTIAFIGECPKLQEKLEHTEYGERLKFLGRTNYFKETIGIGDLFLNPPRQGGGMGAAFAIENEVPILTLGDCDVAQCGEAFVCQSIEEMPMIVHRYITDEQFMEQQKEHCRLRMERRINIDSMENVRKFCEDMVKSIREHEKERL